MGFLAAIPAKAWEILAGVLLIAGFGAFCYVKGGEGPKAELAASRAQFAAFVAQTKALGETAQKAADARKLADQQAKKEADNDHQADVAKLATAWAAEYDRLRKSAAASASRGPVPKVTVDTGLSCNAAAADRISAAVSESIAGARAALDECESGARQFRDSVAQQLEQADRNTEALVCGVKWASKTLH